MSKKRMLADVLWEAANTHLSTRMVPFGKRTRLCEFSCHAFNRALRGNGREPNARSDFLDSLGLVFFYDQCPGWQGFVHDDELQGVRYMWLLLAMHVAEDEGIEV